MTARVREVWANLTSPLASLSPARRLLVAAAGVGSLVVVLGLAWWALDFPFMRRYTKDYLRKHPEMKGKDTETIREACQIFKRAPASIINFLEGTRFTAAKKEKQNSPYRHLLMPKAGGIAGVLSEMGDRMAGIINITII